MSAPDDLKSSAQVWGGDTGNSNSSGSTTVRSSRPTSTEEPSDLPPAYTTSDIQSAPPTPRRPSGPPLNPLEQLSLLSAIDFSKYSIPEATLSDDRSTTTITIPHFYTKPDILAHLVQEQAFLPPKLIMHVKGTHGDSANRMILDFDLWFNLTTLLDLPTENDDSESASRSRMRVKDLGLEEGSGSNPVSVLERRSSSFFLGMTKRSNRNPTSSTPLQVWAKRFCDDKSEHKSFTLTRLLPSASYRALTGLLEGQIRTLLAQLNYRGKITISFPAEYTTVVVRKEPPGAWGFFTSILKIYPVKKYEVVSSVWGFRGASSGGSTSGGDGHDLHIGEHSGVAGASAGRGAGSGVGAVTGRAGPNDSAAARTAQEWWDDWKEVMRNVVLKKQRGRISVEDWIEARMGFREKDKGRDWGFDGGE